MDILEKQCISRKHFDGMGNGLVCSSDVATDEDLLRIPAEIYINYSRILQAPEFLKTVKSTGSLTLPTVLSLYVLYLSENNQDPIIGDWLKLLPQTYDLVFYWSEADIDILPTYMKCEAEVMRKRLSDYYSQVQKFQYNGSDLTFDMFKWAFSTVHSRCIKWPGPIEINDSSINESLQISGDSDYALVPFADLLNHSCDALVSTEIRANELVFTNRGGTQKKSHQMTINYGHHSNAYFLLQYGFVPQEMNPHDFIEFSLDQLLEISQYSDEDKKLIRTFYQKHETYFLILRLYRNGVTASLLKLIFIVIAEDEHWKSILDDENYIEKLTRDYHFSASGLFKYACQFILVDVEDNGHRLDSARSVSENVEKNLKLFYSGWREILEEAVEKCENCVIAEFVHTDA